jgi:two-component system, chemotaxis family, CheB/CheR fusion protein
MADGRNLFTVLEAGPAEATIPVVGVGASAGGLEVFKLLLAHLPPDSGLAIVFVQHLDSKHESLLADILSRATSMPVADAADGMPVEANHVYVMPANVDLTITGGALRLVARTESPGAHMPIDRFLRSLAAELGSFAIGVILSGTGVDGSKGVEEVKAAGGITFAQDLASAKYASMPQAAAATGSVDFVLQPERIAAELVRIGRHPLIADIGLEQQEGSPGEDRVFGDILALLQRATGIDFSLYQEKMIKRRILRRVALRNDEGLAEYSKRLEDDPEELSALHRDLLISVTNFFRDPEAFESLKSFVFPRILAGRAANEPVRVWVAGCATGEEAFSIGILLLEHMDETGVDFPVQIFASDISQPAIDKARRGVYLENIAEDLTNERLSRHFTKVEGGYQVNRRLREMCVFTRHNLIDDPPFSKLDLITCRNVLIYLGSVQKDIIPLFHYALKANGFLMLGASETAADELFSAADGEHRIFAKREMARRPYLLHAGIRTSRQRTGTSANAAPPSKPWNSVDVRKEVDRILLSKYSPAGVVVDENLEVLEIRGKASPFLTLPAGRLSFNLLKLIQETGLFLEIEKLIQHVRRSGEPARQERVAFENDGSISELNVEVVPLNGGKGSLLVIFEPVAGAGAETTQREAPARGDIRERESSKLRKQLEEARERFLSALEENQTSKEESETTTAEALSSYEELLSLNEELETAKEELQSTNQELITVNDELQAKNKVLAQMQDFALSMVETIRQPLLLLDGERRIKVANRAFTRTFQLTPSELVGQPLYSLSGGTWSFPDLRKALDGLFQDGTSFSDFEVELDFPKIGRRVLVLGGYRIFHLKMILLAVDDITERKTSEETARKAEAHDRQVQKMDALGTLAGGIAHDFNNMLTAVIGHSELLQNMLPGNEAALQGVHQIKLAGERATTLTRQLLAFSQRQVLQPKVIDLNAIVGEFGRILPSLVGERITIAVACAPALWHVKVDPGEIGNAIMNLTLNARDAMPSGGTLSIGTANASFAETAAPAGFDLKPGRYVSITVRDTGIGMDAGTQAQIFEPFFTTKENGNGSGLGLATVLGIVKQSGGVILCESELGHGTTFTIFFPAEAEAATSGERPTGDFAKTLVGSEVVLLVEDEELVRALARRFLEVNGLTVLEARNGREGLALCESHKGRIDLLLTDVMMPELGGRELAESAVRQRPDMKIMFMSGYTQDVALKEGIKQGAAFLQKPFTLEGFIQKVRETLDSDASIS